jgi:anti-anti-sigma regulatory factor
VLDLTNVDYLDSAGMHLVHSLRSGLRSHGQKLALVIPEGSVIQDALRLAGMDWRDVLIASTEDAPQAFGTAEAPAQTPQATSADG